MGQSNQNSTTKYKDESEARVLRHGTVLENIKQYAAELTDEEFTALVRYSTKPDQST